MSEHVFFPLVSSRAILDHYNQYAFKITDYSNVVEKRYETNPQLKLVDEELKSLTQWKTCTILQQAYHLTSQPRPCIRSYYNELVEWQMFPSLIFVRNIHSDQYWDNLTLIELDPKTNAFFRMTRFTFENRERTLTICKTWLFQDPSMKDATEFVLKLIPIFLIPAQIVDKLF